MGAVLAKRDTKNPKFSPVGANHGCASLDSLCIGSLTLSTLSVGSVDRQYKRLESYCISAQNTLKRFRGANLGSCTPRKN